MIYDMMFLSNRGAANTEVKDFVCVNYNMESVECTWKRGANTPDNAQQHLYFWYVDACFWIHSTAALQRHRRLLKDVALMLTAYQRQNPKKTTVHAA